MSRGKCPTLVYAMSVSVCFLGRSACTSGLRVHVYLMRRPSVYCAGHYGPRLTTSLILSLKLRPHWRL